MADCPTRIDTPLPPPLNLVGLDALTEQPQAAGLFVGGFLRFSKPFELLFREVPDVETPIEVDDQIDEPLGAQILHVDAMLPHRRSEVPGLTGELEQSG